MALSLFQRASALSRGGRRSVAVFASYLEIYNERLHDLLEPYRPDATRFLADRERKAGLAIRDLPSTGPYVPGLTVARVRDAAGLLSLVREGRGDWLVVQMRGSSKCGGGVEGGDMRAGVVGCFCYFYLAFGLG